MGCVHGVLLLLRLPEYDGHTMWSRCIGSEQHVLRHGVMKNALVRVNHKTHTYAVAHPLHTQNYAPAAKESAHHNDTTMNQAVTPKTARSSSKTRRDYEQADGTTSCNARHRQYVLTIRKNVMNMP